MGIISAPKLRKITGSSMQDCVEALNHTNDLESAINYLRARGDEPNIKGLTNPRIDILKSDGEVIDSFKSLDKLKLSGEIGRGYRIRYVNKVGKYSYIVS